MTDESIRLLLVDDHAVVRKGLSALLSTPRFGINVVGEAADGFEAVAQASALKPDVILLDLVMPRKGGLEAIGDIKADNPKVRILVLTSFSEDEDIIAAIQGGAEGYLLKDCSPDELVDAIHSVHKGRFSISAEMVQKVMASTAAKEQTADHSQEPRLTQREKEVLRYLAQGLPNQEIAEILNISPLTVRSHVRNLLRKLNVSNRTQAALYAVEVGLVSPK
jgi:DNA-binding NarL/FixJ family response regulator